MVGYRGLIWHRREAMTDPITDLREFYGAFLSEDFDPEEYAEREVRSDQLLSLPSEIPTTVEWLADMVAERPRVYYFPVRNQDTYALRQPTSKGHVALIVLDEQGEVLTAGHTWGEEPITWLDCELMVLPDLLSQLML